ncbi:MAG TPA: type II toxin-antitoxin system VapC family toxin [Candidatus Dormibacteraeota bacterium]|nr:type II toxin-antitoxin system VapC family toxin [Candidatus Dormibacteraeota bacterium]
MSVYADSSFVVSLYLTDVHSPEARRRLQGAPPLMLTALHRAEWVHALGQHQFRGTLTAEASRRANSQLVSDEAASLWRAVPLPENAFELCADLARRYGPKLGMRTLDTLHVACALELKAERFWTLDERQAKLAKAVGLKIS